MTLKTALVTGATGSCGPALVHQLLNAGYNVRTLGRTKPNGALPADIQHIAGDINDQAAVKASVQGVDVVFHLAAMLHIENPSGDLAQQYQRINVQGGQTVALAAAEAGVKRFIYFSTVKVYGIEQRDPVNERCAVQPKTMYAESKLQGERAVCAVDGLETTILRLSVIYGPRLKGSWRRLVRAIQKGIFVPVGNLKNVHSLTYVDDMAAAAMLTAEHPAAAGQVFNLVGYEAPTLEEILSAIYHALGKSMPPIRIPASMAKLGIQAADTGFRLIGKQLPFNPEAIDQLVKDEAYSNSSLRSIGFRPATSLVEGWKQSV